MIRHKSRIFTVILIICILFSIQFSNNTSAIKNRPIIKNEPKLNKNWTFMLYFCADTRDDYVYGLDNSGNDLGAVMLQTINSLYKSDHGGPFLQSGFQTNLNVIALYDHPYYSGHPKGNGKLYELQHGNLITLAEYGETNMGDSQTLEDFISYCKINYPANNYALLLSDHGRGYAGFCYDYHAPHPYWQYALGDCLTVEELDTAIENSGGVDVLFFDTCLAGSFEVMWQLADDVHYVVAGQASQSLEVLYHPRDILWELSGYTAADPYTLCDYGFQSGVSPVHYSGIWSWRDINIYDLSKFHAIQPLGGNTFAYEFELFTDALCEEISLNKTHAQKIFGEMRSEFVYDYWLYKTNSMMIDLGNFIQKIMDRIYLFNNAVNIEQHAVSLLGRLNPGINSPIRNNFVASYYTDDNLTGFSICFPYTMWMYQEYLYPNFYNDLDISVDTCWNNFIFSLYPPPDSFIFDHYDLPELYQIHFGPIDPTIDMHIYVDRIDGDPMHIGYASPSLLHDNMGVELEVPGASFVDDMLFGTCTVQIPATSLPVNVKSNDQAFSIVVNASGAASATQDVNITVSHVTDNEVVWEATKTSEIGVGQILRLNVTANDQLTEWEELKPPNKTGFISLNKPKLAFIIVLSTIAIVIEFKRKKRNTN
ncbi:MAG: hypothetical protein FK733_07000 [Asgard group archaeon]|nr:hypothetical protein [Asgard group archaeon]